MGTADDITELPQEYKDLEKVISRERGIQAFHIAHFPLSLIRLIMAFLNMVAR